MEPMTVSLRKDQYALIENLADDNGPFDSKSDAMRTLLDRSQGVDDLREQNEYLEEGIEHIIARHEAEIEAVEGEYEARISELQDRLQATNKRVDEHQELVEYVERERSLQERREERRDAPIWSRAKWFIFGR